MPSRSDRRWVGVFGRASHRIQRHMVRMGCIKAATRLRYITYRTLLLQLPLGLVHLGGGMLQGVESSLRVVSMMVTREIHPVTPTHAFPPGVMYLVAAVVVEGVAAAVLLASTLPVRTCVLRCEAMGALLSSSSSSSARSTTTIGSCWFFSHSLSFLSTLWYSRLTFDRWIRSCFFLATTEYHVDKL